MDKSYVKSARHALVCLLALSLTAGMLSGCAGGEQSGASSSTAQASGDASQTAGNGTQTTVTDAQGAGTALSSDADASGGSTGAQSQGASGEASSFVDVHDMSDGIYGIPLTLSGGTGKATLSSPAKVTVDGGAITVTFLWSSKNYDYMRVGDTKYLPVSAAGEPSAFEIPVDELVSEMTVYADTVAMSTPHEIEYLVTFDLDAITRGEPGSDAAGGQSAGAGTNAGTDAGAAGTSAASTGASSSQSDGSDTSQSDATLGEMAHDIPSCFSAVSSMNLDYAHEYAVDYDSEGRAYICIGTDQHFLLLPEGVQAPDGVTGDVVIIRQPLMSIYAASSATLDLFDKCGAMGQVSLVSSDYDSWTIQSVRDAMDSGDISFVGKYSEPDFERIAASNVDFIIENNMIYHSPATLEKLRELGFAVMVERMSYESHPLGRAEWIRLIGLLTGHEDDADSVYKALREQFEANTADKKSSNTVAFFYISTSGSAIIRLPGDYISKMISLAGGNYVFDGIDTENTTKATMNLEMEAFYAAARDADILIYNNTIDSTVKDLNGLLAKSPLLADFKAVRDGNVWSTGENVYQQVTSISSLMEDFHAVIFDEADGKDTLKCLTRLK